MALDWLEFVLFSTEPARAAAEVAAAVASAHALTAGDSVLIAAEEEPAAGLYCGGGCAPSVVPPAARWAAAAAAVVSLMHVARVVREEACEGLGDGRRNTQGRRAESKSTNTWLGFWCWW